MLEILDEKVKRTLEDVEKEYPKCRFVLYGVTDVQCISGYLYCISRSRDSFKELCKYSHELEDAIVGGSYSSGGTIGVFYEFEE